MIEPSPLVYLPGIIGLIVYIGLVFWAGLRGWWWLALLVTFPAAMGGLMSLAIDTSQSRLPLFQYFGWLALGQITIGAVTYSLGRLKARQANDNSKEFD